MRDGVELSATIWRPDTPAQAPVILSLTPYHVLYRALDPVSETDLPAGDAAYFVPRGYAYVQADVRGTYLSGGCWDYGGIKERQDGYDLVEWLGTREWSNGKVAMTGASYDGTTANAAAVEQPPHLATIVPVSAISRWWGYAYQQGARSSYSGESADIDPPSDTPTDFMFAYGFLPPPDPAALDAPTQIANRWALCDRVEQTLHGYDTQPDYDAFWKERDYLRLADQVNVPVLVTHGQLDFNVKTWEGTQWFEALDTEKVLVIGQWPHASPRGRFPGWDTFLRRWFERWLLGQQNGIEDEPAVRVQTNDGTWRTREQWGPTRTDRVDLTGQPFTFADDGVLTESEMLRGQGQGTRYVRVPVAGTSDLRLAGRPVLHLSAESSLPSTHLIGILCDVGPTGSCGVISRAFLNARYNDSLEQGQDLEPGKRYDFRLEFIDKDHVIAPDHHVELILASSSLTWVASDELRAQNTLHLADSWLDLPLVTMPTSLEVSAPPSAGIGEQMTLSALLTTESGPVSGAPVRFSFQGAEYAATTGPDGVATVSVAVTGPPGEAVAGASYAGTRRLDPSAGEVVLTVG
jgi:X-Pro dipeptidyl-peptidase